MAIQDDNTILNKGDLKAYHERIAPMLGGTFMVGTNNSDYYSTNEKIVGVWTDGKPLYQKTVFFTTPSVVDTNTSVYTDPDTTIKIQDLSGEVCWSTSQGFYARPINRYFPSDPNDYIATYGGGTGNVVVMAVGSYYISKDAYATLRYTKTTDAAGSATTTPGAYDINFPNTWPENKEIYFGNGLYGYRKTGTVTAASDERNMITIATNTGGTIGIVSSGGWIKWGDEGSGNDYKYSINSTLTNLPGWGSMLGAWSTIRTVNSSICLWNTTGLVRTNAPYDIWVTYTKQGG